MHANWKRLVWDQLLPAFQCSRRFLTILTKQAKAAIDDRETQSEAIMKVACDPPRELMKQLNLIVRSQFLDVLSVGAHAYCPLKPHPRPSDQGRFAGFKLPKAFEIQAFVLSGSRYRQPLNFEL